MAEGGRCTEPPAPGLRAGTEGLRGKVEFVGAGVSPGRERCSPGLRLVCQQRGDRCASPGLQVGSGRGAAGAPLPALGSEPPVELGAAGRERAAGPGRAGTAGTKQYRVGRVFL